MGTSFLLAVVVDKCYKVAQAGRFDGFPHGAGSKVLKFLHHMNRSQFVSKVRQCRYIHPDAINTIKKHYGMDANGFMTIGNINKLKKDIPSLSRDTGTRILDIIARAQQGVALEDSLEFVQDSVLCEWAYVIDFDRNSFEAYKGNNLTALDISERFYTVNRARNYCYPVKEISTFSLDDLPTEEAFLESFITPMEVPMPRKIRW
jgi:hypothetical protein